MVRSILLVDDECDSLKPMKLILEDEFTVHTVQSAREALALLERENVDLVIADQRMPEMTGIELLIKIRDMRPEIVRIVLTAYTEFQDMLRAINEGHVYRYIIKPWDIDDMRLTIRQALEWRDLCQSKGELATGLIEANRRLAQQNIELDRVHHAVVNQEKLATVGRFATDMAQEMSGNACLLRDLNRRLMGVLQDDLTKLGELELKSNTLAELATELRDFSQGTVTASAFAPIDPNAPVREVLQLCKPDRDFEGLRIAFQEVPLASFPMDRRQIKHLLLHLLRNAALASRTGGEIEIQIRVEGAELVYQVIDHGCGIPERSRAHIWEPFFSTWSPPGIGLGLNICCQVVELHHGRIEASVTPSGGTTFTVWIPDQR